MQPRPPSSPVYHGQKNSPVQAFSRLSFTRDSSNNVVYIESLPALWSSSSGTSPTYLDRHKDSDGAHILTSGSNVGRRTFFLPPSTIRRLILWCSTAAGKREVSWTSMMPFLPWISISDCQRR